MRQLAVLSFVTLDGVMQSPSMPEEDPSGGFAMGGWAAPYWAGVMPHVERVAMAHPYDILFGRKTYDIFAGHWPNAPKSETGERMNAARKYVATSRTDPLNWANAHALNGDIAGAVAQLKAENGPLLQVHGSAALIQTLQAHDLVDEFRVWTFPVVVGAGKRLFEDSVTPRSYTVQTAEALENGVMHHILGRA
ncbi:dihydrofolate reductase family protein [uncultured Tateyamaria sp.]|uniref:dihydrofolate reductase family protein n=1 Tax=uncultured Tateyamaria sp. TaxID=455651 RepID=UPI0026332691|nr:dihydrofolate reductase family protein [uncultured Tateyamaria sp.]